jgi:hypothetical protein
MKTEMNETIIIRRVRIGKGGEISSRVDSTKLMISQHKIYIMLQVEIKI